MPRPHLRADIIDHPHTAFFELGGKAEIEPGIIDQQGDLGLATVNLAQHVVKHAPEKSIPLEHLNEPEHRHVAHVLKQLNALGGETVAADAPHRKLRMLAAKGLNHPGRVHVAGQLAGDDQQIGLETRIVHPLLRRRISCVMWAASFSASAACTPLTLGEPCVATHSMNDRSSLANGSPF